jgi:mRNA interferase MazF
MVIERGQIWWADLPDSEGSTPSMRRPVVVIQADAFNRSRIQTVIVAIMTSNLARADAPGNVAVSALQSGLPRDSVINVSQVFTLDRMSLIELVGPLAARHTRLVDDGLRLVLGLNH